MDFWICEITIHREAMRNLITSQKFRHSSKPINREISIVIVYLKDISHRGYRLFILVKISQKMQ